MLYKRGKTALALQYPRFAYPEQLPHQPPEVVRGGGDQVALGHIHNPVQPRPPHASRIAKVSKAPFAEFAPAALQFFAFATADTTAIVIKRTLHLGRFVRPTRLVWTLR